MATDATLTLIRQMRQALVDARAVLNPASGFLRQVRSGGPDHRHLEHVRDSLREALEESAGVPGTNLPSRVEVPVEPTKKMIQAGGSEVCALWIPEEPCPGDGDEGAKRVYRAMIAAAPKQGGDHVG